MNRRAKDSAEDIATDIVSRTDADPNIRKSMPEAFKAIGYGDLYKHTRATELSDDYDSLPFDKKVKEMTKVIEKAMRRQGKQASDLHDNGHVMNRLAMAQELVRIAEMYLDMHQRPLTGQQKDYIRKCADLMHLPWQMIASRPENSAVLLKSMEDGLKPEQAIIEYKKHRQMHGSTIIAADSYVLSRDVKTKHGSEFKEGERLHVKEYNAPLVRLETDDGRRLALFIEKAHKTLRGFPKPPSFATMERWMDDGVAKAVDGARVEPDGTSPSGAPSWLLVMGMI